MTFELLNFTGAKCNSVNYNQELHGKEQVLAVSIGLTVDLPNSVLNVFQEGLLEMLYYRNESVEDQGEFAEVEAILPNLRFPKLGQPLKWDAQHAGFTLTIDYGLGEASNIVVEACQVKDFKLCPKEGGTVELTFKVYSTMGIEFLSGKLTPLIQKPLQISLIAPAVTATQVMTNPLPFEADDGPALTVEDVFINGATPTLQ